MGKIRVLDSLTVIWPDGREQVLTKVKANQQIVLRQQEASGRHSYAKPKTSPVLLQEETDEFQLEYLHAENDYIDFNREGMMPHMLSTEGPKIATGDVNGDGLEDFYAGGARNAAGKLFVQQKSGRFVSTNESVWQTDNGAEDIGAAFFDADGSMDLYVVSGGNEFTGNDPVLQDRLYLNDGKGNFSKSQGLLPPLYANGSCVVPGDYDGDGDIDLFVGSRSMAGKYGVTPRSYLLQNDGKGTFTDVATQLAPALAKAGMVTGAV